ncbi:hypothetical protein [Acinetobacter sp. ANC 5414]|uniref:hypothetical protein n=1 Tax=Acinetobacter sp. ANC 5414 TaxID=2731251 RepID=UPI0014903467|nr:hypothetical protein [Acinetobacter sp. ANC 5414]NNH01983.1 hypothetical protein [Acinetobacter sp. ANC 5414]
MGRKKRSKIEYARTIAWYDFVLYKAQELWKCHSEYQFYKQIYQDTGYDVSDNIFKKYKFGLSSPSKAWLLYAERKIQTSRLIFEHPIWSYFDSELNTQESIVEKMCQLPIETRELIIEDNFGAPTPTSYDFLTQVISTHTVDNLCAIYLLYCWGEVTNNQDLSNFCAYLILNNLEKILSKNPHLRRAHIFLFDEMCARMFKREHRELTITYTDKIDWRRQRFEEWTEAVKLASFAEEILLLSNPKLEIFASSTKSPISATDTFYLDHGIVKFENKYVQMRFKKACQKCLDKHFITTFKLDR